ncbi:hypothetical protein CYMTET_2804 [Cymbomonas tetramitiformis]|uniref:PHD-type domain-containing protein n=1 Tax=Cymbomonas tetramitiformis TaxID=36881 RepID=A0AAE0H4L2_9CHLO|nr:hypothetical protein CYMTET_2804 [Cymbomonas tetramitiformis]
MADWEQCLEAQPPSSSQNTAAPKIANAVVKFTDDQSRVTDVQVLTTHAGLSFDEAKAGLLEAIQTYCAPSSDARPPALQCRNAGATEWEPATLSCILYRISEESLAVRVRQPLARKPEPNIKIKVEEGKEEEEKKKNKNREGLKDVLMAANTRLLPVINRQPVLTDAKTGEQRSFKCYPKLKEIETVEQGGELDELKEPIMKATFFYMKNFSKDPKSVVQSMMYGDFTKGLSIVMYEYDCKILGGTAKKKPDNWQLYSQAPLNINPAEQTMLKKAPELIVKVNETPLLEPASQAAPPLQIEAAPTNPAPKKPADPSTAIAPKKPADPSTATAPKKPADPSAATAGKRKRSVGGTNPKRTANAAEAVVVDPSVTTWPKSKATTKGGKTVRTSRPLQAKSSIPKGSFPEAGAEWRGDLQEYAPLFQPKIILDEHLQAGEESPLTPEEVERISKLHGAIEAVTAGLVCNGHHHCGQVVQQRFDVGKDHDFFLGYVLGYEMDEHAVDTLRGMDCVTVCEVCNKEGSEKKTLFGCDGTGCGKWWHSKCHDPSITMEEASKKNWYCKVCREIDQEDDEDDEDSTPMDEA